MNKVYSPELMNDYKHWLARRSQNQKQNHHWQALFLELEFMVKYSGQSSKLVSESRK